MGIRLAGSGRNGSLCGLTLGQWPPVFVALGKVGLGPIVLLRLMGLKLCDPLGHLEWELLSGHPRRLVPGRPARFFPISPDRFPSANALANFSVLGLRPATPEHHIGVSTKAMLWATGHLEDIALPGALP